MMNGGVNKMCNIGVCVCVCVYSKEREGRHGGDDVEVMMRHSLLCSCGVRSKRRRACAVLLFDIVSISNKK